MLKIVMIGLGIALATFALSGCFGFFSGGREPRKEMRAYWLAIGIFFTGVALIIIAKIP